MDRPRGTYDFPPDEWRRLRRIENLLTDVAASHGYRRAETPVIEHAELFARKLGGERLAQTYQFSFRGRSLALRPEHTASMMRLFVNSMQADPLPVRLCYGGPVFRYESPQAGRSRQFLEFGCELIGADGLVADAETILLALSCVRAAGVERPTLVLGHIGIVLGFLDQLRLDHRTQDWLIWSMERLRRGEPVENAMPEYLSRSGEENPSGGALSPEQLDREAVIDLLRQSGVRFESGSRTAEEIVDGLFDKNQRVADRAVLSDALAFVRELVVLAGPPDTTLPSLRRLVDSRKLDRGPVDELEELAVILSENGCHSEDIVIDLGLGRGLRYYTGILFEIYSPGGEGPQLAGGGRYNDLANQLGARSSTPSGGFSIGLERLLPTSSMEQVEEGPPSVLVLPGERPASAFQVAQRLRDAGWTATIDPRERSAAAARRWAARNNFVAVAEVHEQEVAIFRCSDSTTHTYDYAPTVVEVLEQ